MARDLHLANHLVALQVENRHGVGLAVAHVASVQVLGQRDAVDAQGVGMVAITFPGVGTDDIDVRRRGSETDAYPMHRGQIVPATGAPELPAL